MRMMRRLLKKGCCDCPDCGNSTHVGRAAEKRQWQAEWGPDYLMAEHLLGPHQTQELADWWDEQP